MKEKFLHKIHQLIGIDYRSLGLFRIALGVLLLVDLAGRFGDIAAFYTDSGAFSRALLLAYRWREGYFSLHMFSGGALAQTILFVLAAIFAIMLLVGYRTKLATIVSWILLVSLHNRHPLLLQGGDTLLRVFLFWAMFLPLGEKFSVDALRSSIQRKGNSLLSVATFAALMQVCLVYWFTVLFKDNETWLTEYTAVYYALGSLKFQTYLGSALLEYPEFLAFLTRFTLIFERWGPVLAFLPFFTQRVRIAVVLFFVGVHFGFGLCLRVGLFPYISMAGWILFLPALFWDSRFVQKSVFQGIATRWNRLLSSLSDKLPATVSNQWSPATARRMHVTQGLIVLFFFVYVVCWNLSSLRTPVLKMPTELVWIGRTFRLEQRWNMFGKPIRTDGWNVFVGTTVGGKHVDVWNGTNRVDWARPDFIADTYPNYRWRKFVGNLRKKDYKKYRKYFGSYLCRRWNSQHSGNEQVESVRWEYFKLRMEPERRSEKPRQVNLMERQCKVTSS